MGSTVISAMRYRDPHKMIDWLCDTFGFTRKAVHDDGNGGAAHAELTLGDGMIMLGRHATTISPRFRSRPRPTTW